MKGFTPLIASTLLAGIASAHPHHKRDVPVIYSCSQHGKVALTFDDGPYLYTSTLLDTLEAAGHRATFFQNGNNWDIIYNYNSTIQRMVQNNHQVCSHTSVSLDP
jgi:peptidoglycan/xylan/chitin deacetylase (PgdA/CDA1 family)